MFCPKCGATLDDDAKFCFKCGKKISGDNENIEQKKRFDSAISDNQDINHAESKTPRSKRTIIIATTFICLIVVVLIILLLIKNNDKREKDNIKSTEKEAITKEEKFSDNEYIFPNSDTEYLTSKDIENLSTDKLALARNEIIARHGRIYTDEKYKSYFESKSWYNGIIEPEEFDANFENELNGIEKSNIELIKSYETILNDGTEKYYASILSDYQQAEQNNFSGDSSQYPTVNPTLLNHDGGTLYYTLLDLCNDGIPELFISQNLGDIYDIVDIYGYADGNAQHLLIEIDLGTEPLDENNTTEDRAHYAICNNNMIKKIVSNNEGQDTIEYYQLDKNSITLQQIEGASQDGVNYFRHFSGGLEAEKISLEKYKEIAEQYPPKTNISWRKLSDLTITIDEIQDTESVYALAKEYYGDFLQHYKEEEQSGFVRKDLELINPMFSDSLYFPDGFSNSGISLFYTVLDLANDEVPELFISDGDTLYGAYGLYESEGQICPLIYTGTSYMGDRARYYICENNTIKSEGSGGASSNIIAYYQVNPHSQNATCTEAIYQENANYYWGKLDGNNFEQSSPATADEYADMKSKYPIKKDIVWLKLSEFQADLNNDGTDTTYKVTQSEILGSKYEIIDFDMKATSTLQEKGYDHSINVLQDLQNNTCWAEGVPGDGIGEEIIFTSSDRKNVNALFIKPGFTKSEEDFYKNGCPTKIKIKCGDTEGEADLSDFQYSEGSFLIVEFGEMFSVSECIVTIEDIRKGNRYDDTCITEMYFLDLP